MLVERCCCHCCRYCIEACHSCCICESPGHQSTNELVLLSNFGYLVLNRGGNITGTLTLSGKAADHDPVLTRVALYAGPRSSNVGSLCYKLINQILYPKTTAIRVIKLYC